MSSSATLPHSVLYGASVNLTATTFVAGISWGFMTSLYAVCMYSLIRNLRSVHRTGRTVLLATWITLLWIASSLSTLANVYCAIYAYSWQMDYPGEPIVYLASIWNQPIPALAYSTYLVTMWLADAMMLWRLFIFYHGVHPLTRGLIFSLMVVIYIGMVGAGCFMLYINSSNISLFSEYAKRAAIPCFTLSVTLNVFATAFISIRLLLFKRLVERTLGHKHAQASPYMSVAAMLIESSALYALWSLVFLVLYAVNNAGSNVMLATLGHIQVIAPTLIVYRVSKGLGWERSTSAKLTSTFVMSDGRGRSDTMLETGNSPYHARSIPNASKMVFAGASPTEAKVSYSGSG